MASPDPELKPSTFGFSQWIKTKPSGNKDFESPFAASPPPIEDPFFYINYPSTATTALSKPKKADDVAERTTVVAVKGKIQENIKQEKDWSKHTKPCRNVLHGIDPISTAVNPITVKPTNQQVAEEALNSEACGTSIVKVAHKMVSSSRSVTNRGFTVATPSDDEIRPERTEGPVKPDIDLGQYQLNHRRGSRSLPASPNTSPTSRRKTYGNKYFTSPFEPTDDNKSRSWLSMALLGFRKDLSASSATLHEEDGSNNLAVNPSLMLSVESLGPSPKSVNHNLNNNVEVPKPDSSSDSPNSKTKNTFRPVPSEFRELNFWSPTSM